jgi:hypothetical protein
MENRENTTSGEAVEKEEFGSLIPLRVSFFKSALFVQINSNSGK